MNLLRIAIRIAGIEKDITAEFLSLNRREFKKFLATLENELYLKIVVNINDLNLDHDAMDMKIFLEDDDNRSYEQKRIAVIQMTLLQKLNRDSRTVNAMASGVKWERIMDPETDPQAEKIIADRGY